LAAAEAVASDPQFHGPIVALLKNSPWRLQTKLAETLAGSKAGAVALVEAAPPRLLTVPSVAQKLNVVADADLKRQIAERTKNLPSLAQELVPILARVRGAYDRDNKAGRLDVEAGKLVFTKNCAACHRVGGVGTQVGPQLEGLKARGAERLCEDILDPNRAVDPAFRRHVFTLADGTVVSGLVRRDEGAALVVVDQEGKERTIAKSNIESREETGLSLMPAGYEKLLNEMELSNLLAWLLGQ
jgi:putative heme-binding domain-containing protein